MTKTSLMALSIALVTLTACGGSTSNSRNLPPPGQYERTSSHTTPGGTSVETQTQTNVTTDEYGNRTAVIEQSTTTDPPGLFNRNTTTNTRVVRER